MEKTLLEQLLSNKPDDTKANLRGAFGSIACNFEFAVSIDMSKQQQRMDEANAKGFAPVWCNADAKSAILYSAGKINQDDFVDCMTWLNRIHVPGDVALAHFAGNEGEKLVEIR